MFEGVAQTLHNFFSRMRGRTQIHQADFEKLLEQMRGALIDADVPHVTTEQLLSNIRAEVIGKELVGGVTAAERIVKTLHDSIVQLLGGEATPFAPRVPMTLLMVGLQGAGKTTTLAKLCLKIKRKLPQARILVVSLDFHRPAAREQLAQLAVRVGVDYYATASQRPLEALAEALRYQAEHGYDVIGIDTAGRLHTDAALLDELRELYRRSNPTYTFLVLDGMTGQTGLSVAQEFEKAVQVTGAVISKLDSGARAGVSLAFRSVTGKPVFFLGTGEGLDDLEAFIPQRIAQRLLGQGDMATLLEQAQERISVTEREATERALLEGRLTLNDFSKQISMVKKMGSLSSLTKYLPGNQFRISEEQARQGEKEMRMFGAVISSMTNKERINPRLLGVSRKRRIAHGAGVRVPDVDKLLVAFEEIQRYAKLMKNFKMPQ